MTSFLAGVDPAVVAQLDRRYATVCGHLDAIIGRASQAHLNAEDTYAKMLLAFPDGLNDAVARDWLCAALTRLVEVELEKKKVNHSEEGTV